MPVTLNCPACGVGLKVRDDGIGREVACPRCKKPFRVKSPPRGPAANQPTQPPAAALPERSQRPRVFISHEHADRTFVEQTIRPLLQRHGIETWYSRDDIRTGERWEKALQEGMLACDWFLVVLSPRSEKSEWVHREVRWALAGKPHRILPVVIEECDRKAFPDLEALHAADFTQDVGGAGRKILADIIRQLNREARQHQEKVEQLSQANEKLKEEIADLHRKQEETQARLDNVLAFDGNWTHPPPRNPPLFHPLGAGRRVPVIAVVNLKGGVGKTTITANLAAALWSQEPKQSALLLDLDYQANLSVWCLDRKTIDRLRRQQYLGHRLFDREAPDVRTLLCCIEPIHDDRERDTGSDIVAGDEHLGVQETLSLMRWLAGHQQDDLRFRLRSLLHADEVQQKYHFILLDCPPRLSTTCINALTAADYVLIPVLLDERSTEGAPRLLRWLREKRGTVVRNVAGVGVVANKTKGTSRAALVAREQEVWDDLMIDCRREWGGDVCGFETVIPLFGERALGRKFPACYGELRATFGHLVGELRNQINALVEV